MTLTTFPTDVIGPYSHWPRRRASARAKLAVAAAVAGSAAFVHCIVPML